MVYGNQFVANHVPLEEGQNTITAIATDADGNTATASITINAVTIGNYIGVSANTESSVSPLETMLEVDGSFSFAQSSISYTGTGTVEFLDSTNPNEYNIKITTLGIYFFTAEVTDDQSNTYADTIAVVVLDQAQLDALLKAKWGGMKTALINGDVEKALTYHREGLREKYATIYSALGGELPTLVQQMKEISPIFFNGIQAKYRIKQDHNIDGQMVTISYYIYFSSGENGLWQIEKY
jgi:hypothetical protein